MLRKLICISLIAVPTIGLSGCSSMWSGIGNISDYMAEKTKFTTPLRGSKTQEVKMASAESAAYDAAVASADNVVMYDTPVYSDPAYIGETYTVPASAAPAQTSFDTDAPMFDSDGNYIDTSPIPCPEGTYLTADNTCMFLEQADYSADFTQ